MPAEQAATVEAEPVATEVLTYREAVGAAQADEMAADSTVLLLGEDVATDNGVFKTNPGLLERFGPARVRNTPICENTFVGVALGMALMGLRPIVEIMFSDFLPTAADQIVNQLAKYRFMSGGQCRVPVTIRSIGGAGGRFGTQHSATGEGWLLGLPGLRVATAGSPDAAYRVLRAAIRLDDPVVVFEHKSLYGHRGPVRRGTVAEMGAAEVLRPGTDVTIVATLLMAERALEAADALAAGGVSAEVIDPCWLNPIDWPTLLESIGRTRRLVVVEEAPHAGGWGSLVISRTAQEGLGLLAPPRAVSTPAELPVPYSPPLEDVVIPSSAVIVDAVRSVLS
jgi:acetoin:2,6-dichlorophenolindophenol oxidoreductase subunit beta